MTTAALSLSSSGSFLTPGTPGVGPDHQRLWALLQETVGRLVDSVSLGKSSMMKFLKSFFLTLRERFSRTQSPHNLKRTVDDSEKLARYIFSAGHFSRRASRVKAEAYMPSRGEVSVFRIDGLDQASIWEIGSDVARKRERTLYVRCDTKADQVRKASLDMRSDEPPLRHANIIGWPENDKPRQKVIALQLASAAILVLNQGVVSIGETIRDSKSSVRNCAIASNRSKANVPYVQLVKTLQSPRLTDDSRWLRISCPFHNL